MELRLFLIRKGLFHYSINKTNLWRWAKRSGASSIVIGNAAGHLWRDTGGADRLSRRVVTAAFRAWAVRGEDKNDTLIEVFNRLGGANIIKSEDGKQSVIEIGNALVTTEFDNKPWLKALNRAASKWEEGTVYLELRNSKNPIEGPGWAIQELRDLIQGLRDRNYAGKISVFDCGGGSITSYFDTPGKPQGTCKYKISTNDFFKADDRQGWIEAVSEAVTKSGGLVRLCFTGELRNIYIQGRDVRAYEWINALNAHFKAQGLWAVADIEGFANEGKGHVRSITMMLNKEFTSPSFFAKVSHMVHQLFGHLSSLKCRIKYTWLS